MGLDDGLRGLTVDSDERLFAEVGTTSVPIDGGAALHGRQGVHGVATVNMDRGRRMADVTFRGRHLAIGVDHRIVSLSLVGETADMSAFAVDDAVVDRTGHLRVDRTVRLFGADGSDRGRARVPIASSLYVDHGITLTPENQVLALIAGDDTVDVVALDIETSLDAILPEESPAQTQAVAPAAVTACRSYDSMRTVALGYRNNSKSLTTTNISGTCSGRTKPRYLTTAKTYSSVSYDWDGWTTVSSWNTAMSEGKQAGNIAMTATTGDCGKGVDCSGFVSRVWGLSSHVYTSSLDTVSTKVSAGIHAMLPFDIFLKQGSHVIFFSCPWP